MKQGRVQEAVTQPCRGEISQCFSFPNSPDRSSTCLSDVSSDDSLQQIRDVCVPGSAKPGSARSV